MKSVHQEVGPMTAETSVTRSQILSTRDSNSEAFAEQQTERSFGIPTHHTTACTVASAYKSKKPPKYLANINGSSRTGALKTSGTADDDDSKLPYETSGHAQTRIPDLELFSPVSEREAGFVQSDSELKQLCDVSVSKATARSGKQASQSTREKDSSDTSEVPCQLSDTIHVLPPPLDAAQERSVDAIVPTFELNSSPRADVSDPFAVYSILEIIDPSNRRC
jgi:hypothetical protein